MKNQSIVSMQIKEGVIVSNIDLSNIGSGCFKYSCVKYRGQGKTEKSPMTKVRLEWVKKMEGNQVEQKSGCGSKKDIFLRWADLSKL